MEALMEERQEICSAASKLVRIKIFRQKLEDQEEQIIGFECNSQSTNCESRCTYKLLLEDF